LEYVSKITGFTTPM